MKRILSILILTTIFAGELEVDGNLSVSGTINANNQAITNVGTPVNSTDAANVGYVLSSTSGKGRIIALKCPWHIYGYGNEFTGLGSCEVPTCPDGWDSLAEINETTGVSYASGYTHVVGNSTRYCIEQEDSE